MAKNSNLVLAAAVALFAITPALADDASPAPDQLASSQTVTTQRAVPQTRQIDPIARSAAYYGTFQKDVRDAQNRGLNSLQDVDLTISTLAGQNAAQLSRGWLAYAALVTSQSPDFRQAVREMAAAYGPQDAAKYIAADPTLVRRTLRGGNEAVALSLAATAADNRRLVSAADHFHDLSISLQSQGWAKKKYSKGWMLTKVNTLTANSRSERPARRDMVTAFSSPSIDGALQQAGTNGAPSLWDGVVNAASGVSFPSLRNPIARVSRPNSRSINENTANQIASIAAFRIMGQEASSSGQVRQALSQGPIRQCIVFSQLNMNQCIESNYVPFETADCINEHAIRGVSKCFAKATN